MRCSLCKYVDHDRVLCERVCVGAVRVSEWIRSTATRRKGATIGCTAKSCKRSYHVKVMACLVRHLIGCTHGVGGGAVRYRSARGRWLGLRQA